ncbi:MAG: circularly permuted type 2 ATP-grasp protein, partial [Myxococcota bacterium]
RVISRDDWNRIERGLTQRVNALNAFLTDLYGEQRIVKEGVFPRAVVERCSGFISGCAGITPPGGAHINIGGIDLLRDEAGEFIVLEDNVRVPSGVSYVLENRAMMKRLMPRLFKETKIEPVDSYPMQLRRTLREIAPGDGITVVLTPGPFNSAYFEHGYLARRMGVPLVQGPDLYVLDDYVYVKTIAGPKRVSTIYRRIDDLFLDPEVFNPTSMLGVRGLMRAYAKGNVALANAPGNGMADDKATYPFVPDIIRFYLSEEPILGQVETLSCAREEDCKRVLDQLDRMVVKAVDGAGGYGMLVGQVEKSTSGWAM